MLYEFECTECNEIYESLEDMNTHVIACPNPDCKVGLAFRIMSCCNFRVTGYNAKNGYTGAPSYNEVIDENGYAKKRWGK